MERQAQQAEKDATHDLVNRVMEQPLESTAIVEHIDQAALEDFKQKVKVWWDLDTAIKRLTQAARERKKMQTTLSASILEFMHRHNIEDLNTKDGILRYKSCYVKAPLKNKELKEMFANQFSREPQTLDTIYKTLEDRPKVEKVSLRRVKL